ncbi:MAG: hypothetical protein HWE14_05430 [Flavobacteriia bacterium]|nr:hypothetical protein [Flavobacteriia bacterium]
MGFASSEEDNMVVTELNISLEQPENQYFLTVENIANLIENQEDSIIGKALNLINTALLEESLENHPLINEAEVYFTLDGRVSVDVVQHRAIARVRAQGEDVYMNEFGKRFPRSKNHSANVPMITGHIDSSQWREAYHFLQLLDDSPWLGGNLEALQRDSAGHYTVYPRIGKHHIIWGDLEDSESKLQKLAVFYSFLEKEKQMNEVKTIDLRFNDQVVSTKF